MTAYASRIRAECSRVIVQNDANTLGFRHLEFGGILRLGEFCAWDSALGEFCTACYSKFPPKTTMMRLCFRALQKPTLETSTPSHPPPPPSPDMTSNALKRRFKRLTVDVPEVFEEDFVSAAFPSPQAPMRLTRPPRFRNLTVDVPGPQSVQSAHIQVRTLTRPPQFQHLTVDVSEVESIVPSDIPSVKRSKHAKTDGVTSQLLCTGAARTIPHS